MACVCGGVGAGEVWGGGGDDGRELSADLWLVADLAHTQPQMRGVGEVILRHVL
jgi:hypothetical protein